MDRDDRLMAYLQDRLDPAARAAFEAEMAASPELQAEVSALRAAAADLGQAAVPQGAAEAGWTRLSRAIDAERPAASNDNRPPYRALAQAAAVAAVAVAAWQFAVVPRLPVPGSFVPASEQAAGPALRVVFAAGAPMADVTALLQQIGATVSDGPGAIGLYTLHFADAAALEAAEVALAARPDLVLAVTGP